MRVMYPVIRGGAGGDIYFERLSEVMNRLGVDSMIRYYPSLLGIIPFAIKPLFRGYEDYDIIHTNADCGFPFKVPSKPLVIIVHHLVFDPYYQRYTTPAQKLYHKLLFRYVKKSLTVADKIIAMSKNTKEGIEKIFGITNVEVINNGIDTDFFRPTEIKDDPYPDKIKLLYVGNLTKRKGAHLLPQIMEKLDDRFILFYTSGIRTKKIFSNKRMIPLGKISFEKLVEMYNLSDILLVPSIVEGGFSYSAAEAMACKKPVVASVSSGLYEMIENKGGFFCKTVDDFVEKIKILADDENLRKKMGEYNRKRVIKKYNLLNMGKQYKKIYKKLMGKSG